MDITFSGPQFASLINLALGACELKVDPRFYAPALNVVRVQVRLVGDAAEITAVATDRYVIGRLRFVIRAAEVNLDGAEEATFHLDAPLIKPLLGKVWKLRDYGAVVTFEANDNEHSLVTARVLGEETVVHEPKSFHFPPVEKLFGPTRPVEMEANYGVSVDRLGRLQGISLPSEFARRDVDPTFQLAQLTGRENGPLVYSRWRGDDYLEVLVQPVKYGATALPAARWAA